jgi:hypothetical protein
MVDAADAELLGHNFPFRDVLPSYSILNVLYCVRRAKGTVF